MRRDKLVLPVKKQVTVRIPATTSNLGPGFDAMGVALRLYNVVTIGRGSAENPPIVAAAAAKFFVAARVRPFPFSCEIRGNVPVARGLGSSVTVRLGVMHGLNVLSGAGLGREQIFGLCAELEGHPDNAAPASFGGFNLVRASGVQRFPVSPRLFFVLLVPDFEVATSAARRLLPKKISRAGAVASAGNAAAIAAAFASRDYEKLGGNFDDFLHQPFRKKLVPFLNRVIAAAEKAGALGGFLSGSGSTICALTVREPDKVAAAMKRAAREVGAQTIITRSDNRGAQVQ